MSTIHLIAPPNAPTTDASMLDCFLQRTRMFADVLDRLGVEVILYGAEANDAPCTEFVPCLTEAERLTGLDGAPYQYAASMNKYALWDLANRRMIDAIAERKQPRDLICTIGGTSQRAVTDAHSDLMDVEYSIGYVGSYARQRVFESRAWQHWTYGKQGIDDTQFFHAVIPCWLDAETFPFQVEKEPFVLYVGRLTARKGISIACEAAQAAGLPLKVIGHGDPALVTYGEYLGALDTTTRNQWMARASAVFCPTVFIEPFNLVAVEAQMCGTAVISTDSGGFTETVEQGKTGFRCAYLGEFIEAVQQVSYLDPLYIRHRANSLYGVEAAVEDYRAYFQRLDLLWDQGFYARDVVAPVETDA